MSTPAGVPHKRKKYSLKNVDLLLERSLALLEGELTKIEKSNNTKDRLKGSAFVVVNEIAKAVINIKKAVASNKGSNDKYESLEKELSSMSRKELLSIIQPYLEQVGIDIANLPTSNNPQPEKDEEEDDNADDTYDAEPETAGDSTDTLLSEFEADDEL